MKNIRFILAAALLLSFALLFAEAWKFDSDIMVNLTQSQFSDNWAGSELSNITWTASMNNTAQKQLAEWLKNKNTLKLAFGQTHLQKEDLLGETYWEKPQKSTDQIAFESLMQFTLKTFVDPYLSLRADSQFLDEAGTKTLVVNPILFTESAGIMKTIVDGEKTKLNARIGGAVRENWNRRVDGIPVDGGIEGIVEFKQIFGLLNASYNSRLSAYKALFKSDAVAGVDNWKAPDLKWENLLSLNLWKMLSLNLNLDFIYEKEQSPDIQWKEILGLGFSYSLF
ncbi:MAG TPA: DUF3078 domain-containing protein [Candidatus Syntrophosphaera sp.]|jgi:hypothetical protein|nr:DUF3078 domain-containing protein [Candidatus Syntrophosphaera sp.]HOU72000.1 DUF3078 domain-containing protein [Candidatus Syntrophosphaera sp.]HPK83397.1 DUF3078 domain-containing protein [Candidatus Syntrophosphaera sp.]HQK28883.1 DUF3078 domain-containing protein [Candidatus Syntrophosphaera sp.]HQO68024.1 DUF3078 domain-containing protein [Candidatus Syntrophosphaera sp.]